MTQAIKIVLYDGLKKTFKNIIYFTFEEDMIHIMDSNLDMYSYYNDQIKKITIYRK